MLKFTANYAYTNSNFVIQNLHRNTANLPGGYLSLFSVLKNILQRGAIAELAGGHTGTPTRLSVYLEDKIGDIIQRADFKKSLFLIATQPPVWSRTIKGDTNRGYYPAREFFDAFPKLFEEYGFVQQLISPEVAIHEIYPDASSEFTNQQVDFYCPIAKLIIEIDGYHHNGITKVKDLKRDESFTDQEILTVRIDTKDWREKTPTFWEAIAQIKSRFSEKEMLLRPYKQWYERQLRDGFSTDIISYKLLPTAVMRFQLLILELLIQKRLSLTDEKWHIVVQDSDGLSQISDIYSRFASTAILDVFLWLEPLCRLMKIPFNQPELIPINPQSKVTYLPGAIHVDFSLLKRYTDENELHPKMLYVRTDYFSATQENDGKNYFQVATTKPINYELTNTAQTEETLRFFLHNLFGKDDFREGQLPIILNALNRKDTIGLLPTGGGKSLCYQLPCLLQPAVSFVVCPIKSLMYDQKDNLDKAFITRTNYITGELAPEVKETIQRQFADKRYFFIWISPERFQSKSFRNYLSELNAKTPIAYAIVDEVHCMSEWGHDFRTSYLNLTKTVHEFCPQANLIGLTATASLNVLRNIRIEFGRGEIAFNDEDVKTKLDFSRPELQFVVIQDGGRKADTLKRELMALHDENEFLCSETKGKAGLIFTPHVNGALGCYQKSNDINAVFAGQSNWFSGACPTQIKSINIPEDDCSTKEKVIDFVANKVNKVISENDLKGRIWDEKYKRLKNVKKIIVGGKAYNRITLKLPVLSKEDFEVHKSQVQTDFKANKFPLMVATKAFGMGIDKQNIYYTFHYGLPGSTESLYQEAGRAGRWDNRKDDNKDKQAVCRILFSPENLDESVLQELFQSETSLDRLKAIVNPPDTDKVQVRGDALQQLFLFQNGYETISVELDILKKLLAYVLTEPNAPFVNILWDSPTNTFKEEGEPAEKFFQLLNNIDKDRRKALTERALYRLSILGIVHNWTTDFTCHFAVRFTRFSDEQVLQHLIRHLVKYSRNDADDSSILEKNIRQTIGNTLMEKCMNYLLDWSWRTIAYERRTSLQTLYELCLNFENGQLFKQSLDNYFRVDNITIIFQYISDQPKRYEEWLKAFQDKDGKIVQSIDEWISRSENLTRFVESSQDNLGINIVSGIIRLILGDYEHPHGRSRLEQTLSRLKDYFTPNEQEQVLRTIVQITKQLKLPEAARYTLADSIEQFYIGSYSWTSSELDIIHIPQLESVNKRLKTLNRKLYDQLSKI